MITWFSRKKGRLRKHFLTIILSFLSLIATCATLTAQTGAPPDMTPKQDNQRFLAWLAKNGKSTEGKPFETVTLRTGTWEFFFMEKSPGSFTDRVALDDAGHSIDDSEETNWYEFLSTPKLDAKGALKRISFLYRADEIDSPADVPVQTRQKVHEPSLKRNSNGNIEFRGWLAYWRGEFPADKNHPRQITISAGAFSTFIVVEVPK